MLTVHNEEISLSLESDETLYSNVRTVLGGVEMTTLTQPLQALKTQLVELEDKYRHLLSPPPQETTTEESPISETDYQTVELTACTSDACDNTIEADHVTSDSNHVTPDSNHVTPDSNHVTPDSNHVTPNSNLVTPDSNHVTSQDILVDAHSGADFPMTFNSIDQIEPNLDATLISDDITDPLASSSQCSLTQDLVIGDTAPTSKETSRSSSRRSSTIAAFPEMTGRDLHNRSLSQAIPSEVTGNSGVSVEGTPEYGTSILSSSYGGLVSNSEPLSLENCSSLEPEGVDIEMRGHRRAPPDFASRVAAALVSCPSDDDNIVVAIPVKSSSGRYLYFV